MDPILNEEIDITNINLSNKLFYDKMSDYNRKIEKLNNLQFGEFGPFKLEKYQFWNRPIFRNNNYYNCHIAYNYQRTICRIDSVTTFKMNCGRCGDFLEAFVFDNPNNTFIIELNEKSVKFDSTERYTFLGMCPVSELVYYSMNFIFEKPTSFDIVFHHIM